ncbi:MAG: Do family serine endopeptidase [Nitrospirae bacterium]|nr:Do family serine endopeptidase [Nitrospirota bacterium]
MPLVVAFAGFELSAASGAEKPAPVSPPPASELQALVKTTAAKVIPAVVNIASTVVVRDLALSDEGLPFGLIPGLPPRRQYGQGSGVIVSSDGYIITNNHVVADALDVDVLLADRRQFKGHVIATDPKTDVAVVKIQAASLPTVPWGDSSQLAVGEFVLAIGNPLGLNQTVTFGIVSAVGRADVGVADYEDFIQMDAPINPGNSGGALVNVRGELIGINTAIASTTGGSVGVGFAIPSNMARLVMQSLIKTGRVIRGFLGASTQDVTPLLGKLFKLPDVKGAIITDLMLKGSAMKAGLRRGDVVVRFDGKEVVDSGRLRNLIASVPIGSKHRLEIIRDGKPVHMDLVIQEAPLERVRRAPAVSRTELVGHPLGGLLVDDVSPSVARQLGLESATGVVVADVEDGSLAEAAGLIPGDLILEINHQPVTNLLAYQRLVEPIKPKDVTLLLINRQNTFLYVPIEGE